MMYLNLMFGVYLLMTPGIVWAGAGLLVFGMLFAFLGPSSPRRMHAFFAANAKTSADEKREQAQATDDRSRGSSGS
jgi:hypothetical protein